MHPLGWQDRTGDVEGRVPQVQDNRVLGSASPKETEHILGFSGGICMRKIHECAEDIKNILNDAERTEEVDGDMLCSINELVDEILSIYCLEKQRNYSEPPLFKDEIRVT